MAQPPKPNQESTTEEFSLEPSSLDDLTHKELLLLYDESATSIRFSKTQQWRTLITSLSTLLAVVIFAYMAGRKADSYMQTSIILCSLIASSAIYIIIIYELRQNSDRKKLKEISIQFSNLFRRVRNLTPAWEEIFYRLTLLIFMTVAVVMFTAICIYFMMLRFN